MKKRIFFKFPVSSIIVLTVLFGCKNTNLNQSVEEVIVAESENVNTIIPDYVGDESLDQLVIKTRYIGDLFIDNGISLEKSGVINSQGNIRMVINTQDLNHRNLYKPVQGGGPHIWISKQPSTTKKVTPWATSNELILQMRAAVPHVKLEDKDGKTGSSDFSADRAPVTQLSFGIYLHDEGSNKTFAYIIPVYESRGTYQESANNHDTYTSFISSPLESNSQYITKYPKSESLQSKPYAEKKFFKVSITRENLLKGIKDSNIGLSQDLSKYRIAFLGVLFELPNYVESGSNISMVELSHFTAFTRYKMSM